MKINFNKPFRDLDGGPIANSPSLSKHLANLLAGPSKNISAMKAYELALKLNKNEAVELDTTDLEAVKVFIEQHDGVNVIAKGQLLEIINKAKEEEPRSKK